MDFQGERDGIWAWQRINQLFNWLPLAALIEKKIICMHGGIGRSINHLHQIESLQRPITMEAGSVVLMDLLWYDIGPSSRYTKSSPSDLTLFWWISCKENDTLRVRDLREALFCFCRSDPTENDSVEGLRPNARGPGLVTFGVSYPHKALLVKLLCFSQLFTLVFFFTAGSCDGVLQE